MRRNRKGMAFLLAASLLLGGCGAQGGNEPSQETQGTQGTAAEVLSEETENTPVSEEGGEEKLSIPISLVFVSHKCWRAVNSCDLYTTHYQIFLSRIQISF